MEIIGNELRKLFSSLTIPKFKPKLPWLGGDLQTLRNSIMPSPAPLPADARLLAPIEVGAIGIAVNYAEPRTTAAPNVILVHGLGGDENSSYMINAARHLNGLGYNAFRMNYRGVGASAPHSLPPYNAGLTNDLRAVIKKIAHETGGAPSVLMGFSLGGQLVLRMLGEGDVHSCVKAAVSVSAPLDLSAAQQQLARKRNAFYSRYVVGNMKANLENVDHPNVEVDIKRLSSVWAFDEHVIAPVFGYDGAADYYNKVSCFDVLKNIKTPVLAIHAVDDPWIPLDAYMDAEWPQKQCVGCVLTPSGGHVGFHAEDIKTPWHQEAAHSFFRHFIL